MSIDVGDLKWVEWSPSWAPHVKGRYTERIRDPITGMCRPQIVSMVCNYRNHEGKICGATWSTLCSSGAVRNHISQFAFRHAHRDFASPQKVIRPGSKRVSILQQQENREK